MFLLKILLVGFFLRLFDLDGESLWLDEGYSIKFANLKVLQIFFAQENNPPLYYVILHFWVYFFCISEYSIRFQSVIFGSLSIILIYKIGHLIINERVGQFSAILLALSVFHIRYSQEAIIDNPKFIFNLLESNSLSMRGIHLSSYFVSLYSVRHSFIKNFIIIVNHFTCYISFNIHR